MRQPSSVTLVGILALLMGACSGEEGPTASPSPAAPVAVAKPAVPSPAANPEAFPDPTVTQKPMGAKAELGIIQSTNAAERLRSIQSGRQDPFATFPVVPIITKPSPSPTQQTVPPVRPIQTVSKPPASKNRLPSLNNPGNNPGGTDPSAPLTPTLPPLPQPDLAQAVQVTGVIQVGDTTQVIVKAPEEETSRYVRIGQRLSNGQILVKRIEANEGSDPIVVLEQNGIEVTKTVGQEADQPQANAPTPSPAPAPAL